jgi:virginiamycin B lyase
VRAARSLGFRVAAILPVVAAAFVVVGLPSAWAQPAPRASVVRLRSIDPQRLALGDDGSLWVTDEINGVGRLAPDGRFQRLKLGGRQVNDLTSAYGAIWFAGTDTVGRIDAAGHAQMWDAPDDASAGAITAAGGALWFTSDDAPVHVYRLGTNGAISGFPISGARGALDIGDIAAGPDGALWFTQEGELSQPPDGIGRMTTDGRYSSYALPQRRADPGAITTGPDGALWFTEGHAIGRITTAGAITEFPLRTGLHPIDMVAAPDGALWFSADNACVGRITTAGDVTAWPVAGAKGLVGIAAAPDGSFWLADYIGTALWHFVPPAGDAPPAVPCGPPSVTRASGSTRATLVYKTVGRDKHHDQFEEPRMSISRGGRQLFSEVVPPIRVVPQLGPSGSTGSFTVRDLDGDGEPEVILELDSEGTHCCEWTRIYRYVPSRRAYVPANRVWGQYEAAPSLRDLDQNGRVEFVSHDARFTYVFGGPDPSDPIQVWSYRRGRFRETTHRYPSAIRRDAARLFRRYLRQRGRRHETVRGFLAAWAADEYTLGRGAVADSTLDAARRAGYLGCGDSCYGAPRDPLGYIAALKKFLRKTGYVRG